MIKLILATLTVIFWLSPVVLAHPGNTDTSGCHTCRTNCPSWGLSYGEYHCHRAKNLPQPEEPIKSHYGAEGTGYNEPAPEYKAPSPVPSSSRQPANIIQSVPIETLVKNAVSAEKTAYYKIPHRFRENLVKKLTQKYGRSYWVGFYVYTLLPDIK